jgi:hypothetical protein
MSLSLPIKLFKKFFELLSSTPGLTPRLEGLISLFESNDL